MDIIDVRLRILEVIAFGSRADDSETCHKRSLVSSISIAERCANLAALVSKLMDDIPELKDCYILTNDIGNNFTRAKESLTKSQEKLEELTISREDMLKCIDNLHFISEHKSILDADLSFFWDNNGTFRQPLQTLDIRINRLKLEIDAQTAMLNELLDTYESLVSSIFAKWNIDLKSLETN